MSTFLDSFTVHSLTGFMSAVVIPIVAIVGGISFAAYSMYLKVRRQRETLQIYHAERMAAIEKGIELPPLPPELLHDGYRVDYHREHRRWRRNSGLTLVFVGIAVTIALWQSDTGDHSFWWGLVIIAWGLGRVVSEYLAGRETPPQERNGGPIPPDSTPNR
ncbi:MAG TPA: DUF6249 domain-containing protein [Steroidobacteraceae bacterium]|nr:DUF6249 domain-containing protein [Steroidobacteraceae bacterium]